MVNLNHVEVLIADNKEAMKGAGQLGMSTALLMNCVVILLTLI